MIEPDRVFAKCAWRLIPFMMLLYIVDFIDRSNVSFAALTMNRDMKFSALVLGLGAGMFFLGYIIFQIPTAVLVARLGARRIIFCVMLVWGLVSASNAFMREATVSCAALPAGRGRGRLHPQHDLLPDGVVSPDLPGRFTAIFCSAIPIAGIVSGPLSGLILGMDGIAQLHGWQWLFLIQGMPAVFLAFVALVCLPDGPARGTMARRCRKKCHRRKHGCRNAAAGTQRGAGVVRSAPCYSVSRTLVQVARYMGSPCGCRKSFRRWDFPTTPPALLPPCLMSSAWPR